MVRRRQDKKVWNEDLARACECRYEMASRNGSRDQFKWQQGANEIRAVRKDMVEKPGVRGGVSNFPTNKLKKTVLELLLDVVAGKEPVEPEGYAAAMQRPQQGNPFQHDSYLKTIKARGGAYAILMAFHHSAVKTLSIDEICARAQPYCDSDMKANYMAGNTHGAWSSNVTLLKRGLVSRTGGGANYIDRVGFRGRKNYYTLTRDGENFTEAMLQKFHHGVAPTQSSSSLSTVHTIDVKHSPHHTPTRFGRPASSSANRTNELSHGDEAKLRSWITSAQVNDIIDFKVGKVRRKKLHDACDDLERSNPGLKLAHSSMCDSDTSNRRTLTVRVISRPHHNLEVTGSAKRRLFAVSKTSANYDYDARVHAGTPNRSALPPRVAAAQAALERQAMHEAKSRTPAVTVDDANFDEQIKLAIKLSRETASKLPPSPELQEEVFDCKPAARDDDSFDHDELQRAIELSQKSLSSRSQNLDKLERRAIEESIEMSRPSTTAVHTTAHSDASDSDTDDLLRYSPFGDSRPPTKRPLADKKESPAKRSLFPKQSKSEPIDLLSDDEEVGPFISRARAAVATKQQGVIDLDNSCENDDAIEIDDSHDVIVLDDSQDSIAPTEVAESSRWPAAASGSTPEKLYIIIDSRERNRNSTPRQLRMELTRLVQKGALASIWPSNMPTGLVEERGLALGDFAFDIESCYSTGRKCFPVCVERKRVSDLVQRSVSGDHWRQFMRMRDNCVQSIFLIESDTRSATRFTAFGAQELEEWDPFRTLIDDEESIFAFFGRALLSSPSAKFIQTRDETSSLRAVGAVGLMAASSERLRRTAAKAAPPVLNSTSRLVDRLKAGGIPWTLARKMGDILGSVRYLEQLYKECESDECRSALLVPFIDESDEYDGRSDTSVGWSRSIFRVFHPPSDTSGVASCPPSLPRRKVTIEISVGMRNVFQTPTEKAFYTLKVSARNPLGLAVPTVVMQTTAGNLVSRRLFVHVLQAKSMVSRITTNMQSCDGDFVAVAKDVAILVNRECHHLSMTSGKDRRVLLLCGLTPALDGAAKKTGYRTETRAVVDLVIAQLMLEHELVVIQAVRLKGDKEMILQLLALSCYHHQLLFQQKHGRHK